jgi:integrase
MRKRSRDTHLPKSCYLRHGAYWFVRQGKWQRLGSDLQSALAAYGRLVAEPSGGMKSLVDAALEKKKNSIARSTYKQYEVAAYKIKFMLKGLEPHDVLPRHVAQLKLNLAATPNMANRVLSFLRIVFDYALEWQLVDSNPAIGIKRYPEKQRERLISQDEYKAIHAKAPRRLQIIMELCYLTGQRISDVLNIRHADISDDGIYFRQQKTNARLLVRWSPALRETVDAAKALHGNVRALTLLHNRKGKAPDYRTTKDQWNLACERAGVSDATLHDLRAMSGTAAEAQGLDPTQLLGHTSPNQTKRYLRAKKIPQVTGPSFLASPIGHAKKAS